MKKFRFGIIGTANIARGFTEAVQASSSMEVIAIASRSLPLAARFASEFGIANAYASYEELIVNAAEAQIDALYIPLPNSMHASWTIRALERGIPVLCEKPLALSLQEAQSMFDAAAQHGVPLLEAFPYLYQPQTIRAAELVRTGAIGVVKMMQASFGFNLPPNVQTRLDPALGGGSLLDVGCYPISLARLLMNKTAVSATAHARWTDTDVDMALSGTLTFADGSTAQIMSSMDTAVHRNSSIIGSNGVIETDYLNHTTDDSGTLRLRRGAHWSVPFESVATEPGNGFFFEAQTFARAVQEADHDLFKERMKLSLDTAASSDALLASARQNGALVAVAR